MVRIIIQGFGFMGQVHARCYAANPRAEVVAVVDLDSERARKTVVDLALGEVLISDNIEDVLKHAKADALDICLPTDAHPAAAEAGFAAGLHVFCEKPIALDLESANRITAASEKAERQLMVGHCLRFWPEYLSLKSMIQSGEAGRLRALSLFRRATRPGYTAGDWISDPERCLGAALDFHIHDTDLVHFFLGAPQAVFSAGLRLPTGWDHIQTQYLFDDGPMVQAEGGWTYPANRPFQMGYSALFERGSLDFDSTASSTLVKNIGDETFDLSASPDEAAQGELAGLVGYRDQLDYFVARIASGEPIEINTGIDATVSLRTLHAEIKSAESRRITCLSN